MHKNFSHGKESCSSLWAIGERLLQRYVFFCFLKEKFLADTEQCLVCPKSDRHWVPTRVHFDRSAKSRCSFVLFVALGVVRVVKAFEYSHP